MTGRKILFTEAYESDTASYYRRAHLRRLEKARQGYSARNVRRRGYDEAWAEIMIATMQDHENATGEIPYDILERAVLGGIEIR